MTHGIQFSGSRVKRDFWDEAVSQDVQYLIGFLIILEIIYRVSHHQPGNPRWYSQFIGLLSILSTYTTCLVHSSNAETV